MNRRELLHLLSTALVSPAMIGTGSAKALENTVAKSRLGLNISGMNYWASEQVFSNLAANASRWRVQIKDAPFTWDTPLPPMTDDGYPKEIPAGSVIESFLIFTPHRKNLPIELSVFYDGKGKMGYVGGAELEVRIPGCDRVRNLRKDDAFTAVLFETDANDPLRNIRVYERDKTPSSTFREPFLERIGGMSALRFMDWMGTNNSEIRRWEDRPKVGQFGRSEIGVPLEHMIELSNIVKSEPWFNMPHLADDEYIRRFAEQVRQTLDPSLRVYVEYSNELWNTTFGQASHARERGLALGLSVNDYEAQLRYYARRTNEVLAIWENVFGEDKARVVGVYSAQSANEWTSTTILSWEGASEHADVLAIAPYFGGSFGSVDRASEVVEWSLDRLFGELEKEIDSENRDAIEVQSAVAAQHSVKLVAYEGGQHLVGVGGAENDEKLEALFKSANRDNRMGDLYLRHLDNWWLAGGELYTLYSSMGEYSKWGSWGLLEIEGGANPKWSAVQQLLHQRNE